jgi:hypothetical protein
MKVCPEKIFRGGPEKYMHCMLRKFFLYEAVFFNGLAEKNYQDMAADVDVFTHDCLSLPSSPIFVDLL